MKKNSFVIVFIIMLAMLFSVAVHADWTLRTNGYCGKNNTQKVSWKLMENPKAQTVNGHIDSKRLVISGIGEMEDYVCYTNGSTSAPWQEVAWNVNSIVVEEGVTHIGNNAFLCASYSTSYVSLPNSLESVGSYAFCGAMPYVEQLVLPENITYLGEYAFYNNSFSDVYIPPLVKTLPESVFASCDNLKTITIPKSVTTIAKYAFSGCAELTDIYYDGTVEDWECITIGSGNSYLLNAKIHFPVVNVQSVVLDKTNKTLFAGSTTTLTATVLPENADNKSIVWESSNENVATVQNGIVVAKSAGTATITVTTMDGGKTAKCIVSVQNATIDVSSVTLNKLKTTIYTGHKETLTAAIYPENATNKSVIWTSSDKKVVTVTDGVLTAVSPGIAIITVKTVDDDKTASCTVNVIDEPVQSYTVFYNPNGGTGAPASQTKTHDVNLTLSSTKPTRTGYTFKGWSTSNDSTVEYASGATYSANSGVTLYAVWQANTYTVSYNANGGTGAPANQTKTHDVNLTLSTTVPTRDGYTFKGWSTANDSTVEYASGATYSTNADVTLFAVWEIIEVEEPVNPNAPVVSASSVKTRAGEKVTVRLSIDNNPGIAGLQFNVSYDSGVLTLVNTSDKEKEVKLSSTLNSNYSKNPYVASFFSATNDNSNGLLFTMDFEVAPEAENGTYNISVNIEDACDQEFNDVDFATVNGSITVIDVILGDNNGDGSIDIRDVVLLAQYCAGWDSAINIIEEAASDSNGDGRTDIRDVVLLAQFCAGWDVSLG